MTLVIVSLFIVSSVYLFAVSNKFLDGSLVGNWWAVYFENPKDNGLDFRIENHIGKKSFKWKVLGDGIEISRGEVEIRDNKTENIEVSLLNQKYEEVEIVVSDGKDKKRIYKNF